jgi:hypothetical protein
LRGNTVQLFTVPHLTAWALSPVVVASTGRCPMPSQPRTPFSHTVQGAFVPCGFAKPSGPPGSMPLSRRHAAWCCQSRGVHESVSPMGAHCSEKRKRMPCFCQDNMASTESPACLHFSRCLVSYGSLIQPRSSQNWTLDSPRCKKWKTTFQVSCSPLLPPSPPVFSGRV